MVYYSFSNQLSIEILMSRFPLWKTVTIVVVLYLLLVWSVAFSPDAKTLVSSGYDGKVMVWNVAEKKSIATLEKHKYDLGKVNSHVSITILNNRFFNSILNNRFFALGVSRV